ncbi:MAG: thiamine-phosphate kinase [Chlorobiaceae bacterium]|nr:thiamine-phosphate kinase [Chlorobiaceae bacterium]NTW75196.1 thiamine-phosphate kinase [Chlorobiaceae bacterium]
MAFNPISEIGEFGLIERLSAIAAPSLDNTPGVVVGIGDDCAVYRTGGPAVQVATTDLLVEHVHFDLLTTPMHHLGSKAISVNVSDICAMNALPEYALISIAVPGKMPVEMVEQLYAGMAHAASRYGFAIAGGDTSSSPSGLVISVTMTGQTAESRLTFRKGARPGEMICVTGTLGGSAAGLKLLMRERDLMLETLRNNEPYSKEMMAELQEYSRAIRCHLLPEARLDLVQFFHERGIVPTSMIDISDGLAADLRHICERSGVGAHIEESRIPVLSEARAIADELQDDALSWALSGGEDYELLFTLPKEQYDVISSNREISVIGEILPEEEGLLLTDIFGMTIDIGESAGGFDHFVP